jgi:hypothetical protein
VRNIKIAASSTGLFSGAGWICGAGFGVNCVNNKIKYCTNNAPIPGGCGGIAGPAECYIYKCKNTGPIAPQSAGIIVVGNKCRIIKCVNSGSIANGSGGIINGAVNTLIKSCENSGPITGSSGGIMNGSSGGIMNGGNQTTKNMLVKCKNTGLINTSSNYQNNTAGIIQTSVDNTIIKCSNTAEIYGRSAGIVVESLSSKIYKCKNMGKIFGANQNNTSANMGNAAGIVYGTINSILTMCANYGDISGYNCAGIACNYQKQSGSNIIRKCWNMGNLVGAANQAAGLITLSINDTISDCFNQGNITVANCAGLVSIMVLTKLTNSYNSGSLFAGSYGLWYIANACKIRNCYVSSLAVPGTNPLYDTNNGSELYKISDVKYANGKWSNHTANKYLLGTDGTIWKKSNHKHKPYKLVDSKE